MNKYTTALHLKHGNDVLWSLRGEFSENFVVGFLYGALYGKLIAGIDYSYTFDFYANRTTYRFENLNYFMRVFNDYFVRDAQVAQINKRLTTSNLKFKHYGIWLRYIDHGDVDAYLAVFYSLDFLQGLLTSLRAFNINAEQVLLTKPIIDGVMYDVQGLNLLDPNAYYDATNIRSPELEEEEEEEEAEELEY